MAGDAIAERFQGGRPHSLKAFIVAVGVGFAAAVATYKLLRG
jgi:hypothetical protein